MDNKTTISTLVILLILGAFYVILMAARNLTPERPVPPVGEGEPTFCTMDAKICPDGSAVGRVPPTCEFAACPTGM